MIFTLVNETGEVRSIINVPNLAHVQSNLDADPQAVSVVPGAPPEEASQLVEGQWVESFPVAQTKKRNEISSAKMQAEADGFEVDGARYESDPASQQRLMLMVNVAQSRPGFMVDWTLADNSVKRLNAIDLRQIALTLAEHVNAIHQISRELKQRIEKAKNLKELTEISWPK